MKKILTIAAVLMLLVSLTGPAQAETCEYDTEWGILTIYFDWTYETASGHYPYNSGQLEGYWSGQDTLEGQWYQSDSDGYFVFHFHQTGFNGSWMYSSDSNWRGNWDGYLRGCY